MPELNVPVPFFFFIPFALPHEGQNKGVRTPFRQPEKGPDTFIFP